MSDDFSSGMRNVQQGGASYNFESGSAAWQGALFQETMNYNQALLNASAANAAANRNVFGGAGGPVVHLRFVSLVECLVLVVGTSLLVGNLLWSIHPVFGLIGGGATGYGIVKLGGKILRSRFARPVITALSVLVWGVGGFVLAALIWPHDIIWQVTFLCGGLAMAYFDKRAMFRRA